MYRFHFGPELISESQNFSNSWTIPILIPTATPIITIKKYRVSFECSHFGGSHAHCLKCDSCDLCEIHDKKCER